MTLVERSQFRYPDASSRGMYQESAVALRAFVDSSLPAWKGKIVMKNPKWVDELSGPDRPTFMFDPAKDMTAWELAYILRFSNDLKAGISEGVYGQLPDECRRHYQSLAH